MTAPGPSRASTALPDVAGEPQLDWEELLACALVGVERRPLALVPGPPAADPVAGAALSAARHSGLLGAAAVLASSRRAGLRPARASSLPPPPAAEDGRPVAPAAASEALRAILTNPLYRPLLGEWIGLALGAGRRIAPEQVPAVLDAVAGEPADLRERAVEAAGPLAAWLAARNERWSFAGAAGAGAGAGGAAASIGELASRWAQPDLGDLERLAALRALRRADRAAGRRALEATFAGDPPAVRAGALRALAEGLGPGDEALLELALADGRKDVRAEAVRLLSSLPGSRLAARFAARAAPLLSVAGRLRRRLVADPAAIEPAPGEEAVLARDGVVLASARARREDPWWLARQLVAGAPLDTWSERLGADPAQLVALAAADGLSELLAAWSDAAVRQRRADWAVALLGAAESADPGHLAALFATAGREQAEAAVRASLQSAGIGARSALLLELLPGAWSSRLSEEVVAALVAKLIERDVSGASELRTVLRAMGTRLDPGAVDAALSKLASALASLEPDLPDAGLRGRATILALASGTLPARALAAVRADALWRTPLTSLFTMLAFRRSLSEEMR